MVKERDWRLKSTVNVGTEVTLVFAGYRSVYFNDEENQT